MLRICDGEELSESLDITEETSKQRGPGNGSDLAGPCKPRVGGRISAGL